MSPLVGAAYLTLTLVIGVLVLTACAAAPASTPAAPANAAQAGTSASPTSAPAASPTSAASPAASPTSGSTGSAATSTPAESAATPTTASAQASPTTAASTPTTAATPSTSESTGDVLRFEIDASRSEARYLVREQLAGRNAPNDAVGVTKAIEGMLVLRPDGTFAEGSKVTVDLTTLQSDQSRRDRFISDNTLETDTYPTAEFVPMEIRGLDRPLPTSGQASFELVGLMTLHGVEKEVTWNVEGEISDEAFTGKATTRLQFADFGMEIPRVAMVLSVEDDIRLEMDVVAIRAAIS